PFFWAGVIAFVVSLVIAILLARSVYRPIQRVTKAAREMAHGKYDHKIPIAGPSDVKGLAVDFNQMAHEVKISQQRLRDFLSDVSHQLRTPLTSIRGFAQAILDGTAKDGDAKLKAAQVIEDEAKRMIRQVNELLELARIQSGQLKIAQEPVDIASLLRHCQEVFSLRAEEKGIILMIELDEMTSVSGDIDQLEKAFSNLIDNAIKHTPNGGQVSITGRQVAKDSIEVTVANTGSGISQKELPYIFERFYQGDGVESGIGLGLAIAREIVRTHGGDIEVDSTMEKGTRFILRLPTSK
ncbi:MAG: HAMP domain-containing sensor histidine kinase, partial [Dehalococcoidales bacterium]